MKRLFCLWILCLSVGMLYSVEGIPTDSLGVRIFFRQGYRYVQPEFRNNRTTLDKLKQTLNEMDSLGVLHEVSIRAYASPEGTYKGNERLARLRTDSLAAWIMRNTSIPAERLNRSYGGVGWDILREQLATSDLPYRQRVIDIIDNVPERVFAPDGRVIGGRKQMLQRIEGGKLWDDMYRRFYPDIRCCVAVIIKILKLSTERQAVLPLAVEGVCPPQISVDTLYTLPSTPVDVWEPSVHLKTNVLGLGLLMANAAVEIDLCRHLSFNLPVYYSAVDYFSATVKFRTLAFQPEIRYWFSDRNDGWFTGAHFGLAWYNIATDGKYRIQDHDGKSPALGGGLAVGYRLPISGNNRWKMEFSIGAGAYALHYDKYHNYRNGLLMSTEKKTYIGIDHASVSFSYSFGLKKGGVR